MDSLEKTRALNKLQLTQMIHKHTWKIKQNLTEWSHASAAQHQQKKGHLLPREHLQKYRINKPFGFAAFVTICSQNQKESEHTSTNLATAIGDKSHHSFLSQFCPLRQEGKEKASCFQAFYTPKEAPQSPLDSSSQVILISAAHSCKHPQAFPAPSALLLPLPPNEAQLVHLASSTPFHLKKQQSLVVTY